MKINTDESFNLNENRDLKMELLVQHYSAVAELLEGKVVLNVSCGRGYGAAILSQKAEKVIGVDVDKDAISFAMKRFRKDNLEYHQRPIEELTVQDQSFDAVVLVETPKYGAKQTFELFLKQIIRVLKPDGLFIVSILDGEFYHEFSSRECQNLSHNCELIEDEFKKLLKKYFKFKSSFYQTINIPSAIQRGGADSYVEEIYRDDIQPKTKQFNIRLYSNVELCNEGVLNSMCRGLHGNNVEQAFERTAHISVDTGSGFDVESELQAQCYCYDGNNFKYYFDLSGLTNIKSVRFIPLERACMIKINWITSNMQEIEIHPDNAQISMGGIDIFTTIDPTYLIDGKDIGRAKYFTVSGEIVKEFPDYIVWNGKESQYEEVSRREHELLRQRVEGSISQLIDVENKIQKLSQQLEDSLSILALNSGKIENMEHTVSDMLYVSQNSVWYQDAMRRIRKGPTIWWLIRKFGIRGVFHRGVKRIFSIVYRVAKESSVIYAFLQKAYILFSRISPDLRRRIDMAVWNAMNEEEGELANEFLDKVRQCDLPISSKAPLVTVIVPNYNHAKFLRQRLDSIYNQTYSNFEVILLDDCSTDESRLILEEYAKKYPDKTVCSFNEKNVGRVNLQWNKGLNLAKGEYIWIAESDDWCEPNFLEILVPKLDQQTVMIAFARSVFMQEGKKIWSTEEYLHDARVRWDNPFVMTGHEAIERGFAEKNFIPNVSSAIFRNTGKIPDEVMDIWSNINLCGDWIFYLYLVKGGAFSYTNETTNYYRVHKGSTSLKVQRTSAYYEESETVSCYIARNYRVSHEIFKKTLKVLQKHYIGNGYGTNADDVCKWYRLDHILEASKQRYPNVLICNYAMKMGGGEIFPIHLANALRRMGVPVTFMDCRMEECDVKVRKMLDPSVPLIELRTPMSLKLAVKIFGTEIVHSHHGSVDKLVSVLLKNSGCNQVITLHGMYEAIDKTDLLDLLHYVTETCSVFAYIADKNLEPFKQYGYYEKCKFVKMDNGLLSGCPKPIERKCLGIPEDAFVLCLVSRARLDKGWLEATRVVIEANKDSSRPIHLILVGDGEAYEKVVKIQSPFIHAVGESQEPRAYFATSDMGFLPSRFLGESFPLAVIESLMCGRPVLASDLGEISNQITLSDGRMAGALFELQNGQIPEKVLTDMIRHLASDSKDYLEMKACTLEAAERFDIKHVAEKYLKIYQEIL